MIPREFRRAVEAVVRAMTGLPQFTARPTALMSTSWDGDAHSTTASTGLDMSVVFGVPAGVKALLVQVYARDSGSAGASCGVKLGPDGANWSFDLPLGSVGNDYLRSLTAIVPCDQYGDIYCDLTASGPGTLDVWMSIWGYWQ